MRYTDLFDERTEILAVVKSQQVVSARPRKDVTFQPLSVCLLAILVMNVRILMKFFRGIGAKVSKKRTTEKLNAGISISGCLLLV